MQDPLRTPAFRLALLTARAVRSITVGLAIVGCVLLTSLGTFEAARDAQPVVAADRACDVGCATTMGQEAARLVREARSQGRVCGPMPVVTDHVVIERLDGRARVVDFDTAYRLASSHRAWVRQYCVDP